MRQQKSNNGKPGMTFHKNGGTSPGKKKQKAKTTQAIADGKAWTKANGTSAPKKKGH